MSNRIGKYLSTFDGEEGQQGQQQPPPAPPQQQAAPPPAQPPTNGANGGNGAVFPVAALPSILTAMAQQGAQAQQQYVQAQQQLSAAQQAAQAQPPVAPATTQRDQIAELHQTITQMRQENAAERLENYRLSMIGRARAQGLQLVDALVFGITNAEIDASLQVAVAEYQMIAAQVASNIQQQMQAQAAQQQQQTQTQAVVSQVGGQPVASPQPPTIPQQQPVSAPAMVQVAGVPEQQGQGVFTPEQIHYLTTTGLRTGEYARHREQIQKQLRGQLPGPGTNWSWQQGTPQLAPPVPSIAPAPAVMPNVYAGVTMPQVQPQVMHAAPGTVMPMQAAPQPHPQVMSQPMYGHQQMYVQNQQPMMPGGPPQPVQLDQGGQFDPNAARFAASNSITQARMRAQALPSIHRQQ